MRFSKDSAYGVQLRRFKARVLLLVDARLTACPGTLQLISFALPGNCIGE